MKYYVVAGEASGDLHASNLIKAIREKDSAAQFRGCGGDLMRSAGAELLIHYRDMAYMGFWEVFVHLKEVLGNMKRCKADILDWKPDVLVLVDLPGFNLRIAEFAKQHHIKVVYYISPQIWAWKKGRIKQIKRDVDEMMVILPFSFSMRCHSSRRARTSSPSVGSSKKSISGSVMSAIAMLSLRCQPPESVAALLLAISSILNFSIVFCAFSLASFLFEP